MSAVLQEEMTSNWLYAPHAPVRVMESQVWLWAGHEEEWAAHAMVNIIDDNGNDGEIMIKVNHVDRLTPMKYKILNAIVAFFRKQQMKVVSICVYQEGGLTFYPLEPLRSFQ